MIDGRRSLATGAFPRMLFFWACLNGLWLRVEGSCQAGTGFSGVWLAQQHRADQLNTIGDDDSQRSVPPSLLIWHDDQKKHPTQHS
jgi:hypothetical protein